MIKKITLSLMLCCILISCGKKGDPKYKDPEKITKTQIILTNKV